MNIFLLFIGLSLVQVIQNQLILLKELPLNKNNIYGVFHNLYSKTFLLHQTGGIILNENNNIEADFSINFNPNFNITPYAIPIEQDKIILLCTEQFIMVINGAGYSIGNNITYNNTSKNYDKCGAVLSSDNILTVYIQRSEKILFSSFNFFPNNNSIIPLIQNYLYDAKTLVTGKLINCNYFDNQKDLFCLLIFQLGTIKGLLIKDQFNNIEEIIFSVPDINQQNIYDNTKLVKINSNTMIALSMGYPYSVLHVIESDGNNVKEANQRIFNTTIVNDNQYSLSKIDDKNFIISIINDDKIIFHSLSLDFLLIEPKTYTLYKGNLIKFQSIFLNSYSSSLLNIVFESNNISSFLISQYNCQSISFYKETKEQFIIPFSELTQNESLFSIEIVGNNPEVGFVTLYDLKVIEYLPLKGGNDLIGYRIIKSDTFSRICTIPVIVCNKACKSCLEYSDNPNDTKCIICQNNYFEVEGNESICLDKENNYEYLYFDNKNGKFKQCYETCKYCEEKGNSSNHKCQQCKSGYITSLDKTTCLEMQDAINQMQENILELYHNNSVINENNMTIQIINTSKEGQEEALNLNNVSSIDLGECENILKTHYNLSDSSPLLIFKIDLETNNTITNQVEYSVFDMDGNPLDLRFCKESEITISIPIKNTSEINVSLAEDLASYGYDIYNSNDAFYTDVCTPFTSEDNTDIPLEERKKAFYQNYSFCESGCEYNGINLATNKVNCTCKVKTEVSMELNDFSFNDLGEKFKSVFSDSNIKVVKCYKLVFNFNNLIKNSGSWVIIGIFISEIILVVIYGLSGLSPIVKTILSLIETKNQRQDSSPIIKILGKTEEPKQSKSINENCPFNPPSKKSNLKRTKYSRDEISEIQINIENNFNNIPEKNKKNVAIKNIRTFNVEKSNKLSFYSEDSESPISRQKTRNLKNTKIILKNQSFFLNDDQTKKTMDTLREIDTISKYSSNELFSNQFLFNSQCDKLEEKLKYSNEEINQMSFDDALINDNRGFCSYYYSILCYSQLILFTFVLKTDYNLKILKISMFFIGFAIFLTFNTLFYTDSTMSHYYHNKGVIDILYSLPKTIFSSIFCAIITFLLKFLSLSQKNVQAIKEEKDRNKAQQLSSKFLKCIKIKVSVFYIILFILLIVFWYYVSAFCVVYKNTQKHLLKDTLMSFCFSMLYPFAICFITACFRIWGLTSKTKCLYTTSKILQMF